MVRSIALLAVAFVVHVLGDSNDTQVGTESAPVLIYSPHINPFNNGSVVYIHEVEGKNVSLPEPQDQRMAKSTLLAAGLSPDILALIPSSWKQLNANGQLVIQIPDTLGSTITLGGEDNLDPPVQPKPPRPPPPPPPPAPVLPDVKDLPKGTCGQTIHDPIPDARIVGGNEPKAGSVPWIVRLEISAGPGRIGLCGGTLVRVNSKVEATDIVVTAAHCFNPSEGHKVAGSKAIADNYHDRTTFDPEAQYVNFQQFIPHEQYDLDGRKKNDIAIIKLAKPIKFDNTVQPACLPKQDERVPEGTTALAAGWGKVVEGGKSSLDLLNVKLPITSHETCNNVYRNIVEKTQVCAGYPEGGKDSCQGDSGGPLLVPTRQGYVLQGVVSVGGGCARPRVPGIYTRVSGYIDWINSKVQQYSDVAKQTA